MSRHLTVLVWVTALLLAPGIGWAKKAPVSVDLSGFEKIAEKNGVKVYKHKESDIIRVGAVGRIDASPRKIHKALLAYERQVGKIDRLSESRVLERKKGKLFVYQRLNLPVIDDRDFTLRVEHGKDGKTRWVSFWAVTDRGPGEKDGVVRVTHHRGAWELERAADGDGTIVRFMTSIDMAGMVPKWLLKKGAGKELPALFKSICELSVSKSKRSKCR